MSDDALVRRVAALEQRVELLESSRPGRKKLPILVRQEGVCGVDPDSDSAVCMHASLYRSRQGCLGLACQRESSDYYAEYRRKK